MCIYTFNDIFVSSGRPLVIKSIVMRNLMETMLSFIHLFFLVMLQPFDYKDPNENKRHKFLVQSVVPTGEIADIAPCDVEALVGIVFNFWFKYCFWLY